MDHGEHIEFYKLRRARGDSSPLDELSKPKDDLVVWFLQQFKLLENSRQPQGRIPLSEILCIPAHFDLMCPLDQFVDVIVAMDDVYIQHQIAQAKKREKTNERRYKSSRRT